MTTEKKKPKPINVSDVSNMDRGLLKQLRTDLDAAARILKQDEARYVVDFYYQLQDYRIRSANYARSAAPAPDGNAHEPNGLIRWTFAEFQGIEKFLQGRLEAYANAHAVGRWSLSQYGMGPVLSAGLLAHIDIEIANTAGKIHRFAGLDPTLKWIGREGAAKLVTEVLDDLAEDAEAETAIPELARRTKRDPAKLLAQIRAWVEADLVRKKKKDAGEGEEVKVDPKEVLVTKKHLTAYIARRPWNARLKVLCWKIGQSFKKFYKDDSCFYGKLYEKRKALELSRNEHGDFKEEAERMLREKNFRGDTNAKTAYKAGKLPAGRLDLRAARFATKLFLSHWQECAYFARFGKLPPYPYVFSHLGHGDYIPPPHAEVIEGLPQAIAKRDFPKPPGGAKK